MATCENCGETMSVSDDVCPRCGVGFRIGPSLEELSPDLGINHEPVTEKELEELREDTVCTD